MQMITGQNGLPDYFVYLECVLHEVETENVLLQRTDSRASASCDHLLFTCCSGWLQQLQ